MTKQQINNVRTRLSAALANKAKDYTLIRELRIMAMTAAQVRSMRTESDAQATRRYMGSR